MDPTTTPTTPGAPAEDWSFLSNLNDPSKLTPAQRITCGFDLPFTCNAGSHKSKKKCADVAGAAAGQAREKCRQRAAVPPPPVFVEPPPATNVSTSPGGVEAAHDAQVTELSELIHQIRASGMQPAGAIETDPYAPPGDEFGTYGYVGRKRSAYDPNAALEEGGLLDAIPTWLLVAGGLAVAWVAFR